MRLFEVASPDSARTILAVIQGLADRNDIPSELPFAAFKNYIKGDEMGIGTPKALIAFKNQVDPTSDVISDIKDDGKGNVTVILNTQTKSPDQQQAQPANTGQGPSIDTMASSNAKQLQPNI